MRSCILIQSRPRGKTLKTVPHFTGKQRLSRQNLPVEAAVLDGFGDVGAGDVVTLFKVGNGAGDFEDAVVGAGGEAEAFHSEFDQAFRSLVNFAEFFQLSRTKLGVAANAFFFVALALKSTCHLHALPNGLGAFITRVDREFLEGHGGHFDVQIDPV